MGADSDYILTANFTKQWPFVMPLGTLVLCIICDHVHTLDSLTMLLCLGYIHICTTYIMIFYLGKTNKMAERYCDVTHTNLNMCLLKPLKLVNISHRGHFTPNNFQQGLVIQHWITLSLFLYFRYYLKLRNLIENLHL